MPNKLDISHIQNVIRNLEDSLQQRFPPDDTAEFKDVTAQILKLEAEIVRQSGTGEMDRRAAKVLKKRLRRLFLPVRQFDYIDADIPDGNQEPLKKEMLSHAAENNSNKAEEQPAKTFPNLFAAFVEKEPAAQPYFSGEKKAPAGEASNEVVSESLLPMKPDKKAPPDGTAAEEQECLSSENPEWCRIYPFLSSRLAANIQKLFLDQFDFMDIFTLFFRSALWEILQISYSEAASQGINLDQINEKIHKQNGSQLEYPLEALNLIRKSLGSLNGYTSLTAPVETDTKRRKEFNSRTYLFRYFVLINTPEETIFEQIEDQFERAKADIDQFAERCKQINQLAGHKEVNKTTLNNKHFPELLLCIRNTEGHGFDSDWLRQKPFPKNAFKQACLPSMKEAILEWIRAERWLLDLAVGTKIKETADSVYFATDRPGKFPVKFPANLQILKEIDDDEFVIDLKNMRILFPYKKFER
jgi:hypothetical protein